MTLEKGDIVARVMGQVSVVRWKNKRDVFVLINVHSPPVDGNFRDESGNAIKPHVIEDCNAHMGLQCIHFKSQCACYICWTHSAHCATSDICNDNV
jgi:hypothetical protein